MIPNEMAAFIATAAASGIIGNRVDAVVNALVPVQKLHSWFRARLIDPAAVEPSPATDTWLEHLSDADRKQLGALLEDAIGSAGTHNVAAPRGVAVGNNVYGNISNIATQNNYGPSSPDVGWEYVQVALNREGDFDRPGVMKWAAYIAWPGQSGYDVRDRVRIEDLLNELGQDGWELVSQKPAAGINSTDYILRRPKHS